MGVSTLILLGLAIWALSFAYRDPTPARGDAIEIGPGRVA